MITVEELAAQGGLSLVITQGRREWHGANPNGEGATRDGFWLREDGTAFDRSIGEGGVFYTSWEVAKMFNVPAKDYEPTAEFIARDGGVKFKKSLPVFRPRKQAAIREKKVFNDKSLIERGLFEETIAQFGIRDVDLGEQGQAWDYPTFHVNGNPSRWRRKFRHPHLLHPPFTNNKYVWRGKGEEPLAYNLNNVAGKDEVWLVNGEVSVWLCTQAGIPAFSIFSESNDPTDSFRCLIDCGTDRVCVLLDNDKAGEKGCLRAYESASKVGLDCSIYRWMSDRIQSGYDAADFYVDCMKEGVDFECGLRLLPTLDEGEIFSMKAASLRSRRTRGEILMDLEAG